MSVGDSAYTYNDSDFIIKLANLSDLLNILVTSLQAAENSILQLSDKLKILITKNRNCIRGNYKMEL